MSTHTLPPPPPAHPEAPHDDHSGAFGFFRKYQKLILYTAVIFALVTFSITGAMTQFFGDVFSGSNRGPMPTIVVNDQTVELTREDFAVGSQIAGNFEAVRRVCPRITEGSSNDAAECFAILRRASIAEGLDVAMVEVDKAIATEVALMNKMFGTQSTPAQTALMRGMSSLAQYRGVVKEAMRIGNYVRLNALGVDSSDATLMAEILDGKEKITLKAAMFDRKALEEQLKAKGDVKEEDLKKWLEGKDENEKNRLQVYDDNHVSLLLGVGWPEKFDPAQWPDELKEFKFGDEQLKKAYETEKEVRFKIEPVPPATEGEKKYRPLDEQAVKDELTKAAQIDEVQNKLLAKLQDRLRETIKPLTEAYNKTLAEKVQKDQLRAEAELQAKAKPDDAELQQKAKEAKEAFTALELAEKADKEALGAARAAFDFRALFTELTKDKAGFEVLELKGPKNVEALKDLSSINLGTWTNPFTHRLDKGDLGGMPGRTNKGTFLYQVTEAVVRPMKPWDKLKTPIEEAYFTEKSKEVGDHNKKALEDALLRLAKGLIADRVTEIEGKRTPEVDKRFGAWLDKQTKDLAEANRVLAQPSLAANTQARRAWEVAKVGYEQALAKQDDKKKEFDELVAKELEAEVKTEAKKKYAEVMAAAAQEAGFQLTPFGPFARDLAREPWFQKRSDKAVAFLWQNIANELKAGESTDIVEDAGNRRWYLAACDKVEPLAATDVTRREFATRRLFFAEQQTYEAIQQSFKKDALVKRYHYKESRKEP